MPIMVDNLNEYEDTIFYKASPFDENDSQIEQNSLEVMNLRYFMELPDGKKETTFSELCRRVSRVVAAEEFAGSLSDINLEYVRIIEKSIYNDMMSKRFLFNSPALFSAGVGISSDPELSEYLYENIPSKENYRIIRNNKNKNQMMFACFTISVPDSIEGIFDSVKNAAIISKFGGGVGANFGNLRERDALIAGGCGGKASGPISFMETWNTMGSVVVQGGKRRAALMGMLNSNHPDIENFVQAKVEDGKLSYFNISVAIDDKFMEAVKNDSYYSLISPGSKTVIKEIRAKELWDKICTSAHKRGDPGIFFIDSANRDNILKNIPGYNIETTNPCLTGDTLITTNKGEKRIDQITTDDYVLTMNTETKEFIYEKVEFSGCTMSDATVIKIELENGKILKLTKDHKVFTENRGYVEARYLTENDLINVLDDKSIKLFKIVKTNANKNWYDLTDVYDIKVNMNHNFFANRILVHNCGEQPLPNETSCNLGSINLDKFVIDGKFDYEGFKAQIMRSMYYLDLVIDATCYPLDIIKEKTKKIRPVGLGVMGLADACIKLSIVYGSPEFLEFCDKIGRVLAAESLRATIAMAQLKSPFELCSELNIIPKLPYQSKEIIFSADSTNHEFGLELNSAYKIYDILMGSNDIPISLKSALRVLKEDYDEETFVNTIKSLITYGMRNSRRLSIAPTGTISLLLNTSSSIEPNFAYTWTREVTIGEGKKQTLNYNHKYYSHPKELLVSAHDLTPQQHAEVVKVFAPYIDSAISKTVNLPKEATVKDVEEVYEYCYKNGIKGITIYRDGSRNEQPLKKEEKKESQLEEAKKLEVPIETPFKEVIQSTVKERPKIMKGVTTKSDSPYGSIYVTANFDDTGNMFETFISAGKSGSVSKSVTEAFSRVISLALRSGVKIDDIIKTISNISGSEVWVYDTLAGQEIIVKSIPDASGKMLNDLNTYYKQLMSDNKREVKSSKEVKTEVIDDHSSFGHVKAVCPECNSKMIPASGCAVCISCGYSDCK